MDYFALMDNGTVDDSLLLILTLKLYFLIVEICQESRTYSLSHTWRLTCEVTDMLIY